MLLRRLLHTAQPLLMRPPNYRSQSSLSGASTPMTLWIARSHHRHMVMPAVPHFTNPLTSPPSTVPAAPAAPVVVRLHARGSTLRHRLHQVSRIKHPCAPHMGSLLKQRRCVTVRIHFYLSLIPEATCKYHPSGNTCQFFNRHLA